MSTEALKLISQSCIKPDAPKFVIGDTVKVHVRIVGESTAKVKDGKMSKNARAGMKASDDDKKSRIQVFEGIVIAKQHGGINETYTVRRLSHGVGVERVFPLHSPVIEKVEVVRHGKVRRAKLYFLRGRVGKSAKLVTRIVKES